MKKWLIGSSILISFIFSACYENRELVDTVSISQIEKIKNNNGFLYEIKLTELVEGRGSCWTVIHNYNFDKYEYENVKWIYTKSITGKILADSLIYTDTQREFRYYQKYLQGYLEFQGDSILSINFQIPHFVDGKHVDHWDQSGFNGYYKILFKFKPSPASLE